MTINMLPLYDKILVEKVESKENKTSSGIILPNDQKEQSIIVKVLSIGEGRLTPHGEIVPMRVNVGDILYCTKYAGTVMSDTQILIREDDVLGIALHCDNSGSCNKK